MGVEDVRRFVLERSEDISGVSGVGTVAAGVRFVDGKAAVQWCVGEHRSTSLWDSIEALEAIHGHDGKTVVRWLDE